MCLGSHPVQLAETSAGWWTMARLPVVPPSPLSCTRQDTKTLMLRLAQNAPHQSRSHRAHQTLSPALPVGTSQAFRSSRAQAAPRGARTCTACATDTATEHAAPGSAAPHARPADKTSSGNGPPNLITCCKAGTTSPSES